MMSKDPGMSDAEAMVCKPSNTCVGNLEEVNPSTRLVIIIGSTGY